jgi:hypothetical protein
MTRREREMYQGRRNREVTDDRTYRCFHRCANCEIGFSHRRWRPGQQDPVLILNEECPKHDEMLCAPCKQKLDKVLEA